MPDVKTTPAIAGVFAFYRPVFYTQNFFTPVCLLSRGFFILGRW